MFISRQISTTPCCVEEFQNDLKRRIHQQKTKGASTFTEKSYIDKLVYYETCEDVKAAIARDKQPIRWIKEVEALTHREMQF
jgi:predicted GIY-YIG superfamily endonuclease